MFSWMGGLLAAFGIALSSLWDVHLARTSNDIGVMSIFCALLCFIFVIFCVLEIVDILEFDLWQQGRFGSRCSTPMHLRETGELWVERTSEDVLVPSLHFNVYSILKSCLSIGDSPRPSLPIHWRSMTLFAFRDSDQGKRSGCSCF